MSDDTTAPVPLPAGTSGIFNPPPPDTPEAASARLDELAKDPIWQERVKQNDPSARAEHLKLTRVRMGLPAEQQPSVNTFDVMTESIGRDLLIANTRADMMRDEGFSERDIYEHLNNRVVSLSDHRDAERQLANLKRVGSQQEIDAWIATHGGKLAQLTHERKL